MIVAELIEQLSKYPPNASVLLAIDEGDHTADAPLSATHGSERGNIFKPLVLLKGETHRKTWGQVAWCDEDIETALQNKDHTPTPELVAAVKDTWPVRHIDDSMVEFGWDRIYAGIREVMRKTVETE